jgi:hypothetical protein
MKETNWPVAGGEVGAMLRGWSGGECPLGMPATWPAPLKASLQLVLASPAPMVMFWGETGILLYNDAYAVIAGAKHPLILGRSLFDAWPEVTELDTRKNPPISRALMGSERFRHDARPQAG